MAIVRSNKREQLRRSSTVGVVPTIPTSAVTSQTDFDNTWLTTDIMVGELFENTADSRIWFRSDTGIYELGYSGQTGAFTLLSDVPSSYVGYSGYTIRVNSGETGLEFTNITSFSSVTYSYQLSDMPMSGGTANYRLVTTSAGTYVLENNTLIGLSDVSTSAYTLGNMFVMSASTIYDVKPSTILVDLTTAQDISGAKAFLDETNFDSGVHIETALEFVGTETVNITNISTDTGFTYAANTELATSLATRTYVQNEIAIAGGITGYTGAWATIATDQTLTGKKTFSNDTNLTVTTATTLTVTDLNVSNNQYNKITTYTYYGDINTIGSYRTYVNPLSYLETQVQVSAGTWSTYNYPYLTATTFVLNPGGRIDLRQGVGCYLDYESGPNAISTWISDERAFVVEDGKAYMYSEGAALLSRRSSNTGATLIPYNALGSTGVGGNANEVSIIANTTEVGRFYSTGATIYKPLEVTSSITTNTLKIQSSGTTCLTMYDVVTGDEYFVYISGGTLTIEGS